MSAIIKEDLSGILERLDLEKLRDKTVLITGSNGLIGTYIIGLLYLANKEKALNVKVYGISKNEPNEFLSEFKDDENITLSKKNLKGFLWRVLLTGSM